jgi:hypothetical protein
MALPEDLAALRAENARLSSLLDAHGVAWRQSSTPPAPEAAAPVPLPAAVTIHPPARLSPADKVALFTRLFRGRTDVYPVRWEGKTSGKSGYAPACANEWRAGVCDKPWSATSRSSAKPSNDLRQSIRKRPVISGTLRRSSLSAKS